jgi:predicted nucleic acid-binding protein
VQMLDASSALHAWDSYPLAQFPRLWDWLAQYMVAGELTIADVALREVGHKAPECAEWMKHQPVRIIRMTEAMLLDALRIRNALGIVGDAYGSGVGENDLLIVAAARAHGAELLSDEGRQPSLPALRRNYKIPAVCALSEVGVPCLNFVDYLKRSRAVFG